MNEMKRRTFEPTASKEMKVYSQYTYGFSVGPGSKPVNPKSKLLSRTECLKRKEFQSRVGIVY